MKFSIITPCKDRDIPKLSLLAQNLNEQTNLDFEWIIACNNDDIQLPETNFNVKIVDFNDDTIEDARNRAMDESIGDYLIFVDADDFLIHDAIDSVSKALPQTDDTVLDLNYYYTYETEDAYFKRLDLKNHQRDVLPEWGGRKRRRPVKRDFDYQRRNLDLLTDDVPYQHWLNNRYWIYSGDHRFDRMYSQLIVAGKVISRKFIEANDLRFKSGNDLYPDTSFMIDVLDNSRQIIRFADYKYVLMLHNDPINDPSLSQEKHTDRWFKMISSWFKGYLNIKNSDLQLAFGQYTVRTIHRYFYKALVEHSDNISPDADQEMRLLEKYLQLLPSEAFEKVNPISRKIMKLVSNGNFDKAERLMASLLTTREVHKVVKKRGKNLPRVMYEQLYTHMPIKDNVIFYESFLGSNFNDSPKYIYEYIQKHYPGKFIHVWSASSPNVAEALKGRPDTVVVKRFGFKYMYYLATSKYQVYNLRQPLWFKKRPGTHFLSTWHGTPLKRLVFDIENVVNATHLYKRNFYQQSRQWDHLVTQNQFSVDVFSHAFMYPKDKMIKSGYPRNDILSAPNRDDLTKQIKTKLGIPLDKKVILYAPTWRDDERVDASQYQFHLKLNIAKMREQLGDDYVMILRTHYFITDRLDTSGFGNFVFNESSYSDISELYLISDLLITDYSSVFFDYSILKRPILYYVYDYDNYANFLHGFYLDMKKDLPGPLLKTSDQVIDAIENIDQVNQKYHDRYVHFNERFTNWEDGHASERVVNAMFDHSTRK